MHNWFVFFSYPKDRKRIFLEVETKNNKNLIEFFCESQTTKPTNLIYSILLSLFSLLCFFYCFELFFGHSFYTSLCTTLFKRTHTHTHTRNLKAGSKKSQTHPQAHTHDTHPETLTTVNQTKSNFHFFFLLLLVVDSNRFSPHIESTTAIDLIHKSHCLYILLAKGEKEYKIHFNLLSKVIFF